MLSMRERGSDKTAASKVHGTSFVPTSTPHTSESQKASAISAAVGQDWEGTSVTRSQVGSGWNPVPTLPQSGTVVPKTDFVAPDPREDLEKMARRRFQDPKPFKEGAFWWLLYWKDEFVNGKRTRKR